MPMFSPPMTKKLYAKLGNGKKVLIKEYASNGSSQSVSALAAGGASAATNCSGAVQQPTAQHQQSFQFS